MKYSKTILFILLLPFLSFSQGNYNLDFISNVDLGESGNDIWGYVDSSGLEYAIIGSRNGTSVYSLEDPSNPTLRYKAEGVSSTWRDIKSYNDRLYVTCDTDDDGLVIINMENAPDEITHVHWRPTFEAIDSFEVLERCHNLYIDQSGTCYLAGCNLGERGIILLDLNNDPDLPTYLGTANLEYSHDVYVQGDLMISSEIFLGMFGLYDISDKTNPVLINRQMTTTNFTHNAWFSDDRNYTFTTDEKPNAYVESYDISDPENIKFLDRYRPIETENRGVIPHNTHYYNGFLVTSWYTNGVIVIDANKPDNLIEVASYDTFDGDDGDFNGCWGVYPYLPSGNVIASDLNTGLYVLGPNKDGAGTKGYNRACYLEGTIYDKATNNTVNGASIVIQSSKENFDQSSENGIYKTGLSEAGTYNVLVNHPEYLPFSAEAILNNGEVTILDAYLEKYVVAGTTIEAFGNGNPIDEVSLKYINLETGEIVETSSDNNGTFNIGMKPGVDYEIFAGKWGYDEIFLASFIADNSEPLVLELNKGYRDLFNLNQGWTVESEANTGIWERTVPAGTWFQGGYANPNIDDPTDVGSNCYVTGNISIDAPTDDVDNGATVLTSPPMLFADADTMTFSYSVWFYNNGGNSDPNDTMTIALTNGIDTIELEAWTTVDTKSEWNEVREFQFLKEEFLPTDDMQIIVTATDDNPGHLLECGFDNFRAVAKYSIISGTSNLDDYTVEIIPNPANDLVNIKTDYTNIKKVQIIDYVGKHLIQINPQELQNIDVSNLEAGVYLIQILLNDEKTIVERFVKI